MVAREFPNLPLETLDRLTVPVNQQQWLAIAVGFVVDASAIEDESIALSLVSDRVWC